MSDPRAASKDDVLELSLDVALRLAFVGFLFTACFIVVSPFLTLILWAIILAVALAPLFEKLVGFVGKRGLAATVMSLGSITLIGIPVWLTGTSVIDSLRSLRASVEAGTLRAPPPPDWVAGLPVIGERVNAAWELASDDIQTAVTQFEPQLRAIGEWAVGFMTGAGGAVLQTLVALIVASVILTYRESAVRGVKGLARRMAPEAGDEFVDMAGATINSVALGVIGVAAIQALLTAVLLAVFRVPAAGVFALVMFVIATLQIPGLIVMALPIAWAVSNLSGITMVLFIVLSIVVAIVDTPLKAILLGRGLPIPTAVILIGAIGGMVSMGMMGLFLGAVLLGLGYRVMTIWSGRVSVAEAASPEGAEA